MCVHGESQRPPQDVCQLFRVERGPKRLTSSSVTEQNKAMIDMLKHVKQFATEEEKQEIDILLEKVCLGLQNRPS